MNNQFLRTEKLIGKDSLKVLNNSHVAVFGIGGVGGYVLESLTRAGVGSLTIVDKDKVDITNLNRQIIATNDTIGLLKTMVMAKRIKSINSECKVIEKTCFFLPDNSDEFDFSEYDYIVDAVDTVTAKIELIVKANLSKTPIISCMGTGNKIQPELFKVEDIYKTSVCPLAKIMRKELKKRNIKNLKVVYSEEIPAQGNNPPTSISFVPPVAGLIIAGEVIKDLIKWE